MSESLLNASVEMAAEVEGSAVNNSDILGNWQVRQDDSDSVNDKQRKAQHVSTAVAVLKNKIKFPLEFGASTSQRKRKINCKNGKVPVGTGLIKTSSAAVFPKRLHVILRRGPGEELGFDLELSTGKRVKTFVISSIIRRGVAARSEVLHVGLRVHSINRIAIKKLSEVEVDNLLVSCGNQVTLEVDYPATDNRVRRIETGLVGSAKLFPAVSETVYELLEEKEKQIAELKKYEIQFKKIVQIIKESDLQLQCPILE